MLTKTSLVATVLVAIGWLLAPGAAQGKGNVEVTISGGDLAGDVVIPVEETNRLLSEGHLIFPDLGPELSAPVVTPDITYKLDVHQLLDEREFLESMTYYPAAGGDVGRLRYASVEERSGEPRWFGVEPAFEALLNRHIEQAAKAAPATGGSGSGGFPVEGWYAIAGATLAAVLIGSGLAARRLARPHPSG